MPKENKSNTAKTFLPDQKARAALVALALSMLLASLGVSIANVALPAIASGLETSFQWAQWVVLSYLMALTICITACGRLGDLVGRRRILLAGLLIFTIGSLFCGIAPSLPWLIVARAFQGIGAAALMALTIAMVRDAIPEARVGRAMGLLGTTSAIGTALGPSLGGVLLSGPGWRWVFLVMVPLGLFSWALAARALPPAAGHDRLDLGRFDLAGTGSLALALAFYAFAMTLGDEGFGPLNWALLAAAVMAALLFLRVERRVASPLVQLQRVSLRTPLARHLMMNVVVAAVMMSTLVVGPFFLSRGLGLDAFSLGLVMAIGPVISIFTGVPSGQLVDHVGASRVLCVGLTCMTVGAFALALLPESLGLSGYIAAILVLTPGYQLFQSANNTAVTAKADKEERGVISGLLSLSRNFGLITGASVLGAVFAAFSGGADAAAVQVERGMQATFLVAGLLLGLALILALRLRADAEATEATTHF